MRTCSRVIGPLAAAALLATLPGTAVAAPAAADERRIIEEITVTARKRTESVQDVPVAINAFDAEALDRYAINSFEAIADITPQLIMNSGGASSGARLFMRGVGSSADLGFDQTVGIVIDDVFYNRGRWLQQSFMDMERVEVLKGPQALYFGKNTPAGVVVVTTRDPGETVEGYLRTSYEVEAEEWIVEAAGTLPLGDRFGARLAVRYRDMRGWMKNVAREQVGVDPLGFVIPAPENDYNEEEELTGRLTLKWTPTERTDAVFKIQATDYENAGQNTMSQKIECEGPGNTPQLIFGVPDPFDDCEVDFELSKADFPPEIAATAPFGKFNGGVAIIEYESYASSLKIDHDFGRFLLTSVTGWNDYTNEPVDSQDYSAASQVWTGDVAEHEAWTQELRLLSDFDGPVNFMVGAFYQETDFDYIRQTRLIPVPPDPVTGTLFSWSNVNTQEGESWSAFGELIWRITPELELSAGGRYTEEKKDSTAVNDFVHAFLTGVFTEEFFADDFEDEDFSPQVTLTWQPRDEVTVYGGYKTGFKAGGFSHTAVLVQGVTLDRLTFDSETVDGFELGVKTSLLDRRLRLDGVVYRYVFDDQQVSAFDAESTSFTIENAAETISKGVEINAAWLLTEQLQLRADVAYNKARYEEFLGPCYAGQTQEEGCDRLINPTTGLPTSQDLSGKHPVLSPDWNVNAGFTWEGAVAGPWRLSVSADARYSDGYPLMTENRPDMFQDDHWRLDAALRLGRPDKGLELALIGRNLTDEEILLTGTDRPLTGGAAGLPASDPAAGVRGDGFAIIQRRRQWVAQLSWRF